MKILCIALFLITLTGCRNPNPATWEHETKSLEAVEGLEDCTFHRLDKSYVVIRCPNSSVTTNYSVGKTRVSTHTISN